MKAFFVKQSDGSLIDAIIRANDETDAQQYVQGGDTLGAMRDNIATEMCVPPDRGRHEGALSKWLAGPTNLLGELLPKSK